MGNLGSIQNMFKYIGAESTLTSDISIIKDAKKILLPGVGAFDAAMTRIQEGGLRDVLDHKALVEKIPILGICLGMQLLSRSSEEGKLSGLGWIPAKTVRFPHLRSLKVPHMGWNDVEVLNDSPLIQNFSTTPRFYFVHSYYVQVDDPTYITGQSNHGVTFAASIQYENIYGAQFHPEKSHKYGMQLFDNFANLPC